VRVSAETDFSVSEKRRTASVDGVVPQAASSSAMPAARKAAVRTRRA
jgi:hypothetical protein